MCAGKQFMASLSVGLCSHNHKHDAEIPGHLGVNRRRRRDIGRRERCIKRAACGEFGIYQWRFRDAAAFRRDDHGVVDTRLNDFDWMDNRRQWRAAFAGG